MTRAMAFWRLEDWSLPVLVFFEWSGDEGQKKIGVTLIVIFF